MPEVPFSFRFVQDVFKKALTGLLKLNGQTLKTMWQMEFLLKDCVSSQFSLILIDISKLYPSQKKQDFCILKY